MKKIYFFQVNYLYSRTAHLPYTAGALLSYAFADSDIKNEFTHEKIFFIRKSPSEIIGKIENPAVCAFSCYIWNFEFNKAMARLIKEKYPDCTVIFGGHHVAPGDALLNECLFIDYLIHGEGEEAFKRLLLTVLGKDNPENIAGVSYRKDGRNITNPVASCPGNIIDYPSPYLEGFFDKILEEYPELDFMALTETSRGCPNSCAYCDWSNMKSKIRLFPMQRVKAELEWIASHHILGLGFADSNFGEFPRDEEITDYLIEMFNKYGYPKGLQTSYAKNSNQRVFDVGCKLEKYRLSKGITLSFQSMTDEVLQNIGRKNISVDLYKNLMGMYNASGIPTYSELILGLPGETPESFEKSLESLLELGQHHTVYIHNCEWLPCSIMGNPDYVEKYKIGVSKILLNQPHIESDMGGEIPEYSCLVTSTCSMTNSQWVEMNLFSFTVQAFHHMGLLELACLYLHNENGVSYRDFYRKLDDFLLDSKGPAGEALRNIKFCLEAIVNGEKNARFVINDDRFGAVRWSFEEYLFLSCVYAGDEFFGEIASFVLSLSCDKQTAESVLCFQKAMLKRPFYDGGTVESEYNFEEYFSCALENKRVPLKKEKSLMNIRARRFDDWQTFAKVVAWYGRKDNRCIYLGSFAERKEK